MACDPHLNSTVILLHFDGSNGSTTFTDSSPSAKAVTAAGNAQISTAQSKFGGASAYFDGTGDYLTVASSADFALTPGDFTVEFFAHFASSAGNQAFLEFYADANNRWNISLVGNIQFYSVLSGTGSAKITATAPSNSAWHHVALCKYSTTFILFVDGVLVGTSTTTSYHTTNSTLSVGWAGGGGGSAYTGYIDELRITKGVARYTENFTPPTEAFPGSQCAISGVVGSPGAYLERLVRLYRRDTGALIGQALSSSTTGAYAIQTSAPGEHFALVHDTGSADLHWDKVSLYLPMDGTNASTTVIDASPRQKLVVVAGNAQISTAQSRFGGASAYFDGAGDYLTSQSSTDFDFGAGDFTVELCVRLTAAGGTSFLLTRRNTTTPYAPFGLLFSAGKVRMVYSNSSSPNAYEVDVTGTTTLSTGVWYHVAMVRAGATIRLFVNGVQEASAACSGTMKTLNESLVVAAAAADGSTATLNAHIDELRITKGLARYTAAFTPPANVFPTAPSGGDLNAVIYDRLTPA